MALYRLRTYARANKLPAAVQPSQPVILIPRDPNRVALTIYNTGNGSAYISDDPTLADNVNGFPIPGGATLNLEVAPVAPENAIWAAGDPGHDLRIYEIVRDSDTPDLGG